MPIVSNSGVDGRPTVVVDSSALVHLLIDPSGVGEAIGERLRGAAIIAPAVLPFEVSNVLRRMRNSGALSETEAVLAFRGYSSLPVELWPFDIVSERVWQLGHNVSAYDAAFIALAELIRCPLITADARLSGSPTIRASLEVFAAASPGL